VDYNPKQTSGKNHASYSRGIHSILSLTIYPPHPRGLPSLSISCLFLFLQSRLRTAGAACCLLPLCWRERKRASEEGGGRGTANPSVAFDGLDLPHAGSYDRHAAVAFHRVRVSLSTSPLLSTPPAPPFPMPRAFRFPSAIAIPAQVPRISFSAREGDFTCPNPVLAARPVPAVMPGLVLSWLVGHRTQRYGLCRWRPAATRLLWSGSYCSGLSLRPGLIRSWPLGLGGGPPRLFLASMRGRDGAQRDPAFSGAYSVAVNHNAQCHVRRPPSPCIALLRLTLQQAAAFAFAPC
jgi:hypothetical protein